MQWLQWHCQQVAQQYIQIKNGICQLIRQLYVYFQCNAVCPQRQKLVVQDTVDGFMLGLGDALGQIQIILQIVDIRVHSLHVVGFQKMLDLE